MCRVRLLTVLASVAIDVWADSVQTAAVVLGATAAGLAYRQVKLSRHGGGGANVLALWGYLQNDEVRERRRVVFEAIERAGYFDPSTQKWTDREIEAAIHTASIWSVAGALARRDTVPLDLLLDEWGVGIVRYWKSTESVVHYERQRRVDPKLWSSFEWLATVAAAHNPGRP